MNQITILKSQVQLSKNEKLKLQINFMKENNYSFVYSSYSVIPANEIKPRYVISVPEKISHNKYLKNTIIGCLTVVLDKDRFKKTKEA